ncbi:hypothetical protein RchiOBHm_Chr5g0058741 [Rosa chinensis]|uniref:Uncharacterized protein n=1 Tax=Rosa chinensis TaxID=74649 RepID=A0A2P6QH75_ROSCH|nr:hypothetical protein RchiOBHm_Chr5g0058741 [Rosa chinensis]
MCPDESMTRRSTGVRFTAVKTFCRSHVPRRVNDGDGTFPTAFGPPSTGANKASRDGDLHRRNKEIIAMENNWERKKTVGYCWV